jgi:isoleucyl-tRNA synthetase
VASREDTAVALTEHNGLVADEVLATDYATGEPTWTGARTFADETIGLRFWLRKA